NSGAECTTGFCVDGVCCDSGCSGQCEACNVSGHVGTCSALVDAAPHDPKPKCKSDKSVCGGTCDGTARTECVCPGLSVSCRDAKCENGVAVAGASCNGTGACPAETSTTCGNPCVGNFCATDCANSLQCNLGEFCQAGRCAPQLQNGEH